MGLPLFSPSLRPRATDPCRRGWPVAGNRARRIPEAAVTSTVFGDELIIPGDGLAFENGEWSLEWEDLGYPLDTYEGAFLVGPNESWCEKAVAGAWPSWCNNSRRFLVSVT